MRTLLSGFFRLLVGALFIAMSSSAMAAVAYVHELTGTLTAQLGTAPVRALILGAQIDAGTTLTTGPNSNAIIKFEDGQIAVLQADTRLALTSYSFFPARAAQSSATLTFLQGGLRLISGLIGANNRSDNLKLVAGTATIGIRGSAIVSFVIPGPSPTFTHVAQSGNFQFTAPNLPPLNIIGGQNISLPAIMPTNFAPPPVLSNANLPPALTARVSSVAAIPTPPNNPVPPALGGQVVVATNTANLARSAAAANPTNTALQEAANLATGNAVMLATTANQQSQTILTTVIAAGGVPPSAPVGGVIAPTPSFLPPPPLSTAKPPAPPAPPPPAPPPPAVTPAPVNTGGAPGTAPSVQ